LVFTSASPRVGLYKRLTPGYLRLLEFMRSNYTLQKFSKPPKSILITSIGFSTWYESVIARIALESERARCCSLVHDSRVNHRCNLGVPVLWSLCDSLASFHPFNFVWSGDDSFVQRMRRPLFRGKLRSVEGIRVTGELDVNLSGRAFVASQTKSRKRSSDREAILFVSASTT
jgi:hypothetical protein